PEPEPVKKIAKTDPLPWAVGRFECLLFYVGGLKLAVPLVELGGIYQSGEDKLTAIFGQPDWFMGVANVGEFNLRTVDTARWVMPNHYKGDMKENFKFVIQLDRSDWGVACERVAEAITLQPSQVKWRTDRSKRPWLAGTVIDHMCAILDVQGFIELLDDPQNGFKNTLK
ncbi:MAG: chemotaxis protein CheW, partial [Oceanospirillaceae bacterium]|nr:chemotaxis protein CheW [Oceanospirillaceae bacterium]